MERLTKTKLFIDGGDPVETAEATRLLREAGYAGLDGQTTNPSLVAKNPDIAARIERGEKLTEEELLVKYKEIVQEIERNVGGDPTEPKGSPPSHKASEDKSDGHSAGHSISIEVYADKDTSADAMVTQAREFGSWIESAVIKLPTTQAGLEAAEQLKGELRLNMTLCFSQAQAAAVYAATRGSAEPVFVSPFIGRLDDKEINGMDLIANLMRMFKEGDPAESPPRISSDEQVPPRISSDEQVPPRISSDEQVRQGRDGGAGGHVEVLTASVRHVEHILGALALKTHAMTLPFEKAFKPWAEAGFRLPGTGYIYEFDGVAIPYEEFDLEADWRSFDLQHELTDVGLQKFADDWNSLLV